MIVKTFSTYSETKGLDVTSLPGLAASVFMDLCNSGDTARNNNEFIIYFKRQQLFKMQCTS